ncbi:Fur-regulated basic protein FbpA [Metabacillus fastidiosus]
MNIEQKKDELKSELINLNYFKAPDGRQLYQLSYEELRRIYLNVKKESEV